MKVAGSYSQFSTPRDLNRLFTEASKIVGRPVLTVWSEKLDEVLADAGKTKALLELELEVCKDPYLVGVGGSYPRGSC